MMRVLTLSALALSYSLASAPALANTPSTLKEAVLAAIEKHPEVQEKWHEFLASEQGLNASKAGYRPKIDLGVGYDLHRQDYGPNRSYHGAYGEITLTQMLYDGALTRSEVSRLNNLQLVSYFNLLESSEKVAYEAFAAYEDVIRQRELVTLARNNLAKHHAVFKQVEKKAKAGVARAADLEQINGRLALAQANLITETSNLHDVSARYLRVVGSLPPATLSEFKFQNSPLPNNIRDTLLLAYQDSPTYHAALRNILAAEDATINARSDYRPKVNLNARYGSQTYDGLGYDEGQSEASIGIELRYNLYNGNRHRSNIRRSLQGENIAKDQRDLACINIRQNVQVAYNDTQKLAEQLPILNRHRLASDRVATAYKQQFDIGQRTLLDVLDIENEYFQASRAYTNAHYDLINANAKTLAAMGVLSKTLELRRSDLPSLGDLGAEAISVSEAEACPATDAQGDDRSLQDADLDGVANIYDQCPDTPMSDKVDNYGCSIFSETMVTKEINVQFAKESAVVDKKYYGAIEELAKFLRRFPNTKVEIAGHSSARGSASFNQRLSQQRAEAIGKVLAEQFGINASRIQAKGYGATKLLRKDNSPEADEINRRIEAIVTAINLRKVQR